jgi:hypothetical protein
VGATVSNAKREDLQNRRQEGQREVGGYTERREERSKTYEGAMSNAAAKQPIL